MSENEYLLPLNERERALMLALCQARIGELFRAYWECGDQRTDSIADEYRRIHYKCMALEPIGTGGTTEGA